MCNNLDTAELFQLLEEGSSFEKSIQRLGAAISNPSLTELLAALQQRSSLSVSDIAEQTLLSKSYIHQLFSGIRSPGRNAVLCVARVLKADLHETRTLLKLAQKGDLYPRIRRDASIIFAIERDYDLMRLEHLLNDIGEVSLLPDM